MPVLRSFHLMETSRLEPPRRSFAAEGDFCAQHCLEEAALCMLLIWSPLVKCLKLDCVINP